MLITKRKVIKFHVAVGYDLSIECPEWMETLAFSRLNKQCRLWMNKLLEEQCL